MCTFPFAMYVMHMHLAELARQCWPMEHACHEYQSQASIAMLHVDFTKCPLRWWLADQDVPVGRPLVDISPPGTPRVCNTTLPHWLQATSSHLATAIAKCHSTRSHSLTGTNYEHKNFVLAGPIPCIAVCPRGVFTRHHHHHRHPRLLPSLP